MTTDTLITSLQRFGSIPAQDHPQILAAWQPRMVAEGQILVPVHTVCQELFFIQQGILRTVMQPLRGREVTYLFARENQFSTILAGFTDNKPMHTGIQAVCSTQLLVINRFELAQLYQQLPYLPALFMQLTQSVLVQKIHTQQRFMGLPAMARYQTFLRYEADIAPRLPQHMIASYLGITPQSLSRLRAERSV